MKRRILSGIIAAMCLLSASCGSKEPETTVQEEAAEANEKAITAAPSEITAAVLAEITINSALEKGMDDMSIYFAELDTSVLEDVSYYMCASGAYPDEIAVFKFNTAEAAEQNEAAVQTRLDKQISTYETYTPDEFYKLEDAVLTVKGNYIFYFVTENNSRASEI
ncbi:MAG: DUF4358 domain-containing protein, partial [Ruminiclostridium sp.]|nr:DUF4358 domain-containing protein [Ruminiclostridium sp.]